MKLTPARLVAVLILGAVTFGATLAHAQTEKRDIDTVLVEQRLKRWKPALDLTDEQVGKIRPLLVEESKAFRSWRENDKLTEQDRIEREKTYRESAKARYKAILNDEQMEKLDKFQDERRKPKK